MKRNKIPADETKDDPEDPRIISLIPLPLTPASPPHRLFIDHIPFFLIGRQGQSRFPRRLRQITLQMVWFVCFARESRFFSLGRPELAGLREE